MDENDMREIVDMGKGEDIQYVLILFFLKGDTSACDQEVAEIVSAAEDGTIGDNVSFFSFPTLFTFLLNISFKLQVK